MLATTLGAIAAALALVQYVPYIADVIRGKTKPHAFSWFVWGVPAGVVFLAQLLTGGGAGSWATGVTAAICTAIFVLALFYGERNITAFDWWCLLGSLAAIAIWVVTNNPLGAVVLVTIADLLAFGPTIRKSMHKPHEETLNTYVTSGIKWTVSIMALSAFSAVTLTYPLAMVLGNLGFALFLALRRRKIAA
jgi:hypothetical protein